jgi:LysM repeat protein
VSSIELSFDEGVAMTPRQTGTALTAFSLGSPGRSRGSGVRLTRRGRFVLFALLLLLTGLVAVLAAASTGEAAAPAGPNATVVVQPGDTLWSIASRYAPGPDPFGTIERIRELNGLDGYTVHAGQRLQLPPRRG